MSWNITKAVVVPYDFSKHADEALKKAVGIVEDRQQIHALHVLPFMIPTEPGVVWATIDDQQRMEHALANMQEKLAEIGLGDIQTDVRFGDPGQVVSDRAEELGAELIVIGSHGRTGLTRFVLGSVAERVTRLAHCPVLVIKCPELHK
ncbi:MAG: universal stress protein [Planctomycetales bacterium]|nr:universal stress protein [Planctomycetales bacterium]